MRLTAFHVEGDLRHGLPPQLADTPNLAEAVAIEPVPELIGLDPMQERATAVLAHQYRGRLLGERRHQGVGMGGDDQLTSV